MIEGYHLTIWQLECMYTGYMNDSSRRHFIQDVEKWNWCMQKYGSKWERR